MKKIECLLPVLALASFALVSCQDVLNEEIVSGVTADFYNEPEGFTAVINAAYVPLRAFYGDEIGTALTVFGTDEYTNGGHGSYHYMNQYTADLNSESPTFWHLWSQFYKGINTCNTAVNRTAESNLPQEEINARIGEARFLRAHYYFVLVRQFGPVHLTLEETMDVETEAERTSEEVIYAAIVDDLEFAIENLPDIQSEFGRATRPAAKHMLSLVLLTRGYQDFAESGDFAEAADLAIDVIDNSHHRLLANMGDVFDHDNEQNDEVIWSVQYTQDKIINGPGNRSHMYFGPWYTVHNSGLVDALEPGYGRPWIRYRPTPWGLENFRPLDIDSRYNQLTQLVWYFNSTNGIPDGASVGDTAIWVTDEYLTQPSVDKIKDRLPGVALYTWNLNNMNDEWYRPINMFPWVEAKFGDYKREGPWSTEGSRDHIVYRLAETYLVAAEALLMDGKPDEAVQYVNKVRRRGAYPGKEGQMEITTAELDIDFILDERARELFGEQKRWFDLTRTGKLLERVRLHNPEAVNIQAHHVLRPIPANQLTRTTNEYSQNPGY